MKTFNLFLILILTLFNCSKKGELTDIEIKKRIKQWVGRHFKDTEKKYEEIGDTLRIILFKGSTSVGVWAYSGEDMYGRKEIFVDIFALVVTDVRFSPKLSNYLHELNLKTLNFCNFQFSWPKNSEIGTIMCRARTFGSSLGEKEFIHIVGIVGVLSDRYDDEIVKNFGGLTLLEAGKERFYERLYK